MNYFLGIFTPDTWLAFREHGAGVMGFRNRYRGSAEREVRVGDYILCYITGLSRWCGILRVQSESYEEDTPIFADPDPYTIRFQVDSVANLDLERAIPIQREDVWNGLSITQDHEIGGPPHWTIFFRRPLNRFTESDGVLLVEALAEQYGSNIDYPFNDKDRLELSRRKMVRALDRQVEVEIPAHEDDVTETHSA